MASLSHYLLLSAVLFSFGLTAVLIRRNAILVLVGIELMLNAANLNFVAFWRFGPNPDDLSGLFFVLFSIAVAAAEAAIGLAILIILFRNKLSINVEDLDELKG